MAARSGVRKMSRKEIVQTLEANWGVKARYLGMPSCAYEITGEKRTFTIDKEGRIMDPDGREHGLEELLTDALEPEARESEEPFHASAFPLYGFTADMLRNLVNMLAGKERLITAALALEHAILDAALAEELAGREIGDVDSFIAVWDELEQGRAPGMKFSAETRTLLLEMPKQAPTKEEMEAFAALMVFMVNFAKCIKSASRKPSQEENPKFAFRTWLIRLGMNGDEFKAVRKVLLARLSGNSSFRHDPGVRDFLDAFHGCANSDGAEGGA